MDTYAFILGRQPELAVAEILALLNRGSSDVKGWRVLSVNQEVSIINLNPDLDASTLFQRLGGSVKLLKVFEQMEAGVESPALAEKIAGYLSSERFAGNRLTFGLSAYGSPKPEFLTQLPGAVKELLSERSINSRYIEPSGKSMRALSSAQVLKTGLTEGGFEVAILCSDSQILLGRTLQVQPFEDFAHRDFDKPQRRIDPGLLPPKLARLMINLAGSCAGSKVLDPFCGSGVVLAEGALMGYRMSGLDCSSEALAASRANLEWLEQEYPGLPEWEVHRGKAQNAVRRFSPLAFDAVVGEGDLGPIFSRPVTKKQTMGLVKRYKSFYTTVLSELRSVVRPGGRVVLAVPRWVLRGGESVGLSLDTPIRLMGYRKFRLFEGCAGVVPETWLERPLVYHRQGQKTAREIICLEA